MQRKYSVLQYIFLAVFKVE